MTVQLTYDMQIRPNLKTRWQHALLDLSRAEALCLVAKAELP